MLHFYGTEKISVFLNHKIEYLFLPKGMKGVKTERNLVFLLYVLYKVKCELKP